ncbi:hypothetical protein WN943_002734 [Citrus x changshan-huyou]
MEKQVEEVYTISKFQEFQQELVNKIYCEVFSCGGSEYEVIENDEKSREKTFRVIFEKDEGEIRCVCSMFEYKGVLCKHTIAVLSCNRVQLLPEKYILRRWRKDVRRFSSKVKVSYDARSSSIEHQRYREECTAFYDVAEVASKNEESHKNIMGWIEKAMKDVSLNVRCDGDDTTIDGGSSSNIQDPVVSRRKGRPPSQRKQKQFKRPKQKSKNVSINTTIEDAEIHDLSSQVATTIPIQESNMSMPFFFEVRRPIIASALHVLAYAQVYDLLPIESSYILYKSKIFDLDFLLCVTLTTPYDYRIYYTFAMSSDSHLARMTLFVLRVPALPALTIIVAVSRLSWIPNAWTSGEEGNGYEDFLTEDLSKSPIFREEEEGKKFKKVVAVAGQTVLSMVAVKGNKERRRKRRKERRSRDLMPKPNGAFDGCEREKGFDAKRFLGLLFIFDLLENFTKCGLTSSISNFRLFSPPLLYDFKALRFFFPASAAISFLCCFLYVTVRACPRQNKSWHC